LKSGRSTFGTKRSRVQVPAARPRIPTNHESSASAALLRSARHGEAKLQHLAASDTETQHVVWTCDGNVGWPGIAASMSHDHAVDGADELVPLPRRGRFAATRYRHVASL